MQQQQGDQQQHRSQPPASPRSSGDYGGRESAGPPRWGPNNENNMNPGGMMQSSSLSVDGRGEEPRGGGRGRGRYGGGGGRYNDGSSGSGRFDGRGRGGRFFSPRGGRGGRGRGGRGRGGRYSRGAPLDGGRGDFDGRGSISAQGRGGSELSPRPSLNERGGGRGTGGRYAFGRGRGRAGRSGPSYQYMDSSVEGDGGDWDVRSGSRSPVEQLGPPSVVYEQQQGGRGFGAPTETGRGSGRGRGGRGRGRGRTPYHHDDRRRSMPDGVVPSPRQTSFGSPHGSPPNFRSDQDSDHPGHQQIHPEPRGDGMGSQPPASFRSNQDELDTNHRYSFNRSPAVDDGMQGRPPSEDRFMGRSQNMDFSKRRRDDEMDSHHMGKRSREDGPGFNNDPPSRQQYAPVDSGPSDRSWSSPHPGRLQDRRSTWSAERDMPLPATKPGAYSAMALSKPKFGKKDNSRTSISNDSPSGDGDTWSGGPPSAQRRRTWDGPASRPNDTYTQPQKGDNWGLRDDGGVDPYGPSPRDVGDHYGPPQKGDSYGPSRQEGDHYDQPRSGPPPPKVDHYRDGPPRPQKTDYYGGPPHRDGAPRPQEPDHYRPSRDESYDPAASGDRYGPASRDTSGPYGLSQQDDHYGPPRDGHFTGKVHPRNDPYRPPPPPPPPPPPGGKYRDMETPPDTVPPASNQRGDSSLVPRSNVPPPFLEHGSTQDRLSYKGWNNRYPRSQSATGETMSSFGRDLKSPPAVAGQSEPEGRNMGPYSKMDMPKNSKESEKAETGSASAAERPSTPKREPERVAVVIPPSPPPGPPSALVVAMTRLADLESQMEFEYARHMQLTRSHQLLQAQIEVLEKLPVGMEAFQEDFDKCMAARKEAEQKEEEDSKSEQA